MVFSDNLNDNTADLKIVARMTNLDREDLTAFTADNFLLVPEPSALSLLLGAGIAGGKLHAAAAGADGAHQRLRRLRSYRPRRRLRLRKTSASKMPMPRNSSAAGASSTLMMIGSHRKVWT